MISFPQSPPVLVRVCPLAPLRSQGSRFRLSTASFVVVGICPTFIPTVLCPSEIGAFPQVDPGNALWTNGRLFRGHGGGIQCRVSGLLLLFLYFLPLVFVADDSYTNFDNKYVSSSLTDSVFSAEVDNSLADSWPYTWKPDSLVDKCHSEAAAAQIQPDVNLSINISQCWPGLPTLLIGTHRETAIRFF